VLFRSPLSDIIDRIFRGEPGGLPSVASFARVLAKVHREGFVLGDTKASNMLVAGEDVYVTDLEQSTQGGDPAWDIAEFLYYTAKLSLKNDSIETIAREFLKAYKGENGTDAIRRAKGLRFLVPFQPFLVPNVTTLIRELLSEYSS
jgi:tRNA A-37 threonylcarbamoyl transferase component Bud32